MSDPTTEGFTATEAEIEGMMRNLCAYALSEPDPLQRYVDLTHQQVLFDGIVAAIRRARGRALADLLVAGVPVAEVAKRTNLTTEPRVRKLISVAGETERVKAADTARRAADAAAKKAAANELAAQKKAAAGELAAQKKAAAGELAAQKKAAAGELAAQKAAARKAAAPQKPKAGPRKADQHLVPALAMVPTLEVPDGKRVLTPAERVALGLPADGPIPRTSGGAPAVKKPRAVKPTQADRTAVRTT
ncbi:MAG: hypothetical protein HOV79_21045 [Hamadaea sp.]|nr:hypothetical protein [Hamadaea sp.]